MVKKRKTSRRRNGFTVPIALVAGIAPGVIGPIMHTTWHGPMGGVKELGRIWTGYDFTDGSWDWNRFRHGLFPAMLGGIVHMLASKFGINRYLGNAGVPFIRI